MKGCGDPDLLAGVAGSVKAWRFKPLGQEERPSVTSLTFRLKNGLVGLIWDSKDYPISESDATRLVRSLPNVASQLEHYPGMMLEVDWYPEERDGIFYLFHLYQSGAGMDFTTGWYWVNAYTGEIWDGLNFKEMKSVKLGKLRKSILQRAGPHAGTTQYSRV